MKRTCLTYEQGGAASQLTKVLSKLRIFKFYTQLRFCMDDNSKYGVYTQIRYEKV